MIAESSVFIDTLRPKKDNTCAVKIKVTFLRKRKYYPIDLNLHPLEYEKVMNALRKTPEQKELFIKINTFLAKANDVIKSLTIFTFTNFEDNYFEQRNIHDSVSFAFDKYITELKIEKRIGTAESYKCAKVSIEKFQKNVSFADITPKFLKRYQKWMLDNGNSVTTVGIYLRSLRTIFNLEKIDKSLYPFGKGSDKYSIPTSKNTKKALTVAEISNIYNYQTSPMSLKDMAKDYWMFFYLSNGMNVKDFCNLTWSNIDDDVLKYVRAKTKNSKGEQKSISVALKPESISIIKKWGIQSLNKKAYVFPHYKTGMTPEQQRNTHKQLTKTINEQMETICRDIGITKKVTTYFARHSFATVLKRAGTSIEMISDLLGHSSVNVTKNYLDGFEQDQIKKATDVLTIGFLKAE